MKKIKLLVLLAFIANAIQANAQLDKNYKGYYRLTTQFQGTGKSLDIINDAKKNKPVLAKTGNYSGQKWKITPIGGGYYRLTTAFQGTGKSLDIINDAKKNKPVLAKTGNYSGQKWKITSLGGGYYRLTTAFQGTGKSLDIINDAKKNKPVLAKTGNYSGQKWKIEKIQSGGGSKIHSSVAKFERNLKIIQTKKHKIRIDELSNGNPRYSSWSISSNMNQKPSMVINTGDYIREGTGGNCRFEFKNGVYKYVCQLIPLREDGTPPARLIIYKNGKEISRQAAEIIE